MMINNNQEKPVRNFLYMDISTLYSMYSQVFEGITDSITEEKIIQAITSNTEGVPLTPARSETQATDAHRRVESYVLHDHMYNRLEDQLWPSIIDASEITSETAPSILPKNPLLKVSGRAEVEDYERIRAYLTQFNELGKVIAYAAKSKDPEHKKRILDILVGLANPQNAGQRKQLESELEKLIDATREARDTGLLQDQFMLNRLAVFAEQFNPTGYEILIVPNDKMQFRGILSRDFLRISPQLISSLYGGQSELSWTMVGIVTHVQGMYQQPKNIELASDPTNPMMLDAYRNMFRKSRFFERMFLESYDGLEIIVSPLAVYREFRLTTRSDS